MEAASETLAFEKAALSIDQIQALRRVQEQQFVSQDRDDDDVLVAAENGTPAFMYSLFDRVKF